MRLKEDDNTPEGMNEEIAFVVVDGTDGRYVQLILLFVRFSDTT